MKLTNLSLSIMIALGVAACGGSDGGNNDNTPAPVDPPKPDTTPTPPAPTPDDSNKDDKIVDPTGTKVVDGRDLTKESTVGGLQYIRREASDYDRVFNPAKPASATPLLGVSLDEQNPKLTNIVLARRDLEREEDKAVRAQFAGGLETEPLTPEGKPQEKVSLQAENFKNVDILAGAFKQVGSAKFGDTDDRLDPVTHDINTHIQNNVDKDREFTRERVEFVYTPRYEYRQPYVDYPNKAPTATKKESDLANDPVLHAVNAATADYEAAPLAPPLPGRNSADTATLQAELAAAPDADGKTWTERDPNYHSRHPVNTGTGTDAAWGNFHNDKRLYGNFDSSDPSPDSSPDAPDALADAAAWRNMGTYQTIGGPAIPPTTSVDYTGATYNSTAYNGVDPKKNNVVDWNQHPSGTNRVYGGPITRNTWVNNNTSSVAPPAPSDMRTSRTYDYKKNYANNGAYPNYPYEMFGYPFKSYNEEDNNTLTNNGQRDSADSVRVGDDDPHTHEHIYLEREKFTAIREPKSIRPLVNPVANDWKWELNQKWNHTYPLIVEEYRNDPLLGRVLVRRYAASYTKEYNPAIGRVYQNTVTPDLKYTGDSYTGPAYAGGTPITCGGLLECKLSANSIPQLQWAYWQNPVNEGNGQRGEFRGPAYTGWDQDVRTVQFADTRIWKPDTPGYRPEYERKYGANLIWWSTQDSAFENWATSKGLNPRARRVDRNVSSEGGDGSENLLWGNADPQNAIGTDARDRDVEIQPTGDITNGLIRVGGDKYSHTGKMATLGQELIWKDGRWEDHHKTTTRIFGHYHLAWADQEDDRKVKAMSLNSYSGARSFVAKVKDYVPNAQSAYQSPWGAVPNLDSEPLKYSIGAEPMTLQKVQYGRVTSNLDLVSGEGPLGDGFLRAPFAKKGEGDSVDNYFFRGVDATTIEQMAALPQEGTVKYVGHALMYGINNDFHGMTGDTHAVEPSKNLPNAFNGLGRVPAGGGGTATIGLGNFVEADVDFGAHKVKGDVYNAWLVDDTKPGVVHDKLVSFEGDITGNTVLGKADRAYDPGNDNAEFRAAFFGSMADEMGGAFNSVASEDKYGSAYETGDWGGVFGAKKLGSANTFQGDDGANVYGN